MSNGFQYFNLSSNLLAALCRVDIPPLYQLDSDVFTPSLAVHAQLDLAKLALSQGLKLYLVSDVDFLSCLRVWRIKLLIRTR